MKLRAIGPLSVGLLVGGLAIPTYAGEARVDVRRLTPAGADATFSHASVLSADGRVVAFTVGVATVDDEDSPGNVQVYWKNLATDEVRRVSESVTGEPAEAFAANLPTSITADGRYVAFHSNAGNLVPGDTNQATDSFVKDMRTGAITRVSTSSAGAEAVRGGSGPVVFSDGSAALFLTEKRFDPARHPDRRMRGQVYRKDLRTGQTTLVSTKPSGNAVDGTVTSFALSADGSTLSYASYAAPSYKAIAWVKNLRTGSTKRLSRLVDLPRSADDFRQLSLSADGSRLAFSSRDKLRRDDTNSESDVYVATLTSGKLQRASLTETGKQRHGQASFPLISGNGRRVVFAATQQLVPGLKNRAPLRIFLKDLRTGAVRLLSVSTDGAPATLHAFPGGISANGKRTVFTTASRLVPDDPNSFSDVYLSQLP